MTNTRILKLIQVEYMNLNFNKNKHTIFTKKYFQKFELIRFQYVMIQ